MSRPSSGVPHASAEPPEVDEFLEIIEHLIATIDRTPTEPGDRLAPDARDTLTPEAHDTLLPHERAAPAVVPRAPMVEPPTEVAPAPLARQAGPRSSTQPIRARASSPRTAEGGAAAGPGAGSGDRRRAGASSPWSWPALHARPPAPPLDDADSDPELQQDSLDPTEELEWAALARGE